MSRDGAPGPTEAADPRFAEIDRLPVRELVALMNEQDATVAAAVAEAGDAIAAAVGAIVERLRAGGRLVYVGAGTSGRIASLDAAEIPSTFGTPPGQVVAVSAGDGEDVEDDADAGARDLAALAPEPRDAVVAVSASGETPYVLGALGEARRAGSLRVAVVCARGSAAARAAEHEIAAVVGPELIAGSTRLKAGTAQKLVLNTISTVAMVQLGRTYGGLMLDVVPGNEKLRARARRNLELASGANAAAIEAALSAAGGDARVALVSLLAGVDSAAARTRLADAGGSVRKAVT